MIPNYKVKWWFCLQNGNQYAVAGSNFKGVIGLNRFILHVRHANQVPKRGAHSNAGNPAYNIIGRNNQIGFIQIFIDFA